MQKHITILGVLYIALGIMGILAGLIVLVSVTGGGLLSGDRDAMAITAIIGPAIAVFLFLISAPGLIGGVGLLQRRSWARILVLILECLNLLNLPLGTALGIYTLWALTKPETQSLLRAGV